MPHRKQACFFTRPISGLVLVLSVLSVAFALWQHHRMKGKATSQEDDADF